MLASTPFGAGFAPAIDGGCPIHGHLKLSQYSNNSVYINYIIGLYTASMNMNMIQPDVIISMKMINDENMVT